MFHDRLVVSTLVAGLLLPSYGAGILTQSPPTQIT